MNIPLFTAEASVYRHNATYRSAGLSDRGGRVFPQQLHCDFDCLDSWRKVAVTLKKRHAHLRLFAPVPQSMLHSGVTPCAGDRLFRSSHSLSIMKLSPYYDR
jgi:hypothetical protein